MDTFVSFALDRKTENIVSSFWKSLHEMHLSSFYFESKMQPQVLLCLMHKTDQLRCETDVDKLASILPPFDLNFNCIGFYPARPPYVAWMSTPNLLILRAQRALVQAVREYSVVDPDQYYDEGHWNPHIGLAINLPDEVNIAPVIKSSLVLPEAHTARVTEIIISHLSPIQPGPKFLLRGKPSSVKNSFDFLQEL